MDFILIGKIVNTHGIKGELRIISDFEKKENVFVVGNYLYISNKKIKEEIVSYRKHKNYDMVMFSNHNSINDVLIYKGQDVYVKREDLNLGIDEYLDEDLTGFEVYYNDEVIGSINSIEKYGLNKLFNINNKLIPFNNHFIEKISLKEKRIELKNVEGLI